jgi:hypothetical protein
MPAGDKFGDLPVRDGPDLARSHARIKNVSGCVKMPLDHGQLEESSWLEP